MQCLKEETLLGHGQQLANVSQTCSQNVCPITLFTKTAKSAKRPTLSKMKPHGHNHRSSQRTSRYEDALLDEAESSVFMSLGIADAADAADAAPVHSGKSSTRRHSRSKEEGKEECCDHEDEFVDFLFKSLEVNTQKKCNKNPTGPFRRFRRVFSSPKQLS